MESASDGQREQVQQADAFAQAAKPNPPALGNAMPVPAPATQGSDRASVPSHTPSCALDAPRSVPGRITPPLKATSGTLFTFGYNGGGQDRLMQIMSDPRAILIDVRYSPQSRRLGMGQSDLVKRFGSQYRWVEALGNERYRGGPIKIHDLQAGTRLVRWLIEHGRIVVLMCCCAKVAECHRRTLALAIAGAMPGLKVIDL